MITQAPRGTKDWFGKDIRWRGRIEELASELSRNFNFQKIDTPAFEHTSLFERGVGETTDIVQKEMYTFEDKGGRSISLKPEGTAPVIRAYLEHNMYAKPAPTKLYYFSQAFRYEKPASGRLRQHHQFGCELIGSSSPLAELEVIMLAYRFIEEIGLKNVRLHINTIGEGVCRKNYTIKLKEYLTNHYDDLCPLCKERMEKNPLRVIDCKEKGCSSIVKNAPRTIDYLDDECEKHFSELKNLLEANNIDFEVDSDIVRGLDYYTKTVFEFIDEDGLTLCGGGRYNNLVKEIDGKQDLPSVGFGMGIERIIFFLEKAKIELVAENRVDLYVGVMGDNIAQCSSIVNNLRRRGLVVELDLMGRSVKAQMKYANKLGVRFLIIIGDDELNSNRVSIKDMDSSMMLETDIDGIFEAIINNK